MPFINSLGLACVAAATNAVQDLLLADEQLARAAISDAVACDGNTSYITKANNELSAAQASIAKQDDKSAGEHYEHGWEYMCSRHATAAVTTIVAAAAATTTLDTMITRRPDHC